MRGICPSIYKPRELICAGCGALGENIVRRVSLYGDFGTGVFGYAGDKSLEDLARTEFGE